MTRNLYHTKYLIIGAGLSGLSAAYHLGDSYLIVEAADFNGGTAATLNYKGFKLDNAIHILYFRDLEMIDWIKTLGIELMQKQRNSAILIDNSYVKFPLQYNLRDLPRGMRFRSALSICSSIFWGGGKNNNGNLEDYSLSVFGKYLTDIFMRPYNEKLFGAELSGMNTEWMGDYVPRYSKYRMTLSAFSRSVNHYGRNSVYYYPVEGGISKLAESICSKLNPLPLYNKSLIKLSAGEKTAYFSGNLQIKYEHLITTIPLNKLMEMIEDLPVDLKKYIRFLSCSPTTILHILIKGNINHHYFDWIYIPESRLPIYRITLPGNINPANCPPGYTAITVEFGGGIKRNHNIEIECVSFLKKTGIIKEDIFEIEFYWKLLPCGYVVYDEFRNNILAAVFPYLNKNNIWSIGRYGSWEYSNMEDAMLHGKKIAEKLKDFN
jgi:protoporphyrinogen oxidase